MTIKKILATVFVITVFNVSNGFCYADEKPCIQTKQTEIETEEPEEIIIDEPAEQSANESTSSERIIERRRPIIRVKQIEIDDDEETAINAEEEYDDDLV